MPVTQANKHQEITLQTIERNRIKVLVIGAGNMGSGFVKQVSAAGQRVSVTARDSAKANALTGEPSQTRFA
jgi:glutamyl-tRNA reductase